MRVTRQYEIAIKILEACARTPRKQWTTEQVARTANASKHFTAHIVAGLVRCGYLKTERGRRGGLQLAMPPDAISLGELLRLSKSGFSEPARKGPGSLPAGADRLDMIVAAGMTSFVRFMTRYTVADLVSGSAFGSVACFDCNLINPSRHSMGVVSNNPAQRPAASSTPLHRLLQDERTA